MSCKYPNQTGQGSYRKGCRCERCRAAKSLTTRGRPPRYGVCPDCGGRRSDKSKRCAACAYPLTPVDRIMNRVVIVGECWEFHGDRNAQGYGRLRVCGKNKVTHRITYEHYVGPIPEGLQLDHLCVNPPCCNPDHLEPVTPSENVRRSRRNKAAKMEATS